MTKVMSAVRTGALAAGLLFGLASCAEISADNFRDLGPGEVRYRRAVIIASGADSPAESQALSPLAWNTKPLESALSNLERADTAARSVPISIDIASVGIRQANVEAVGVAANGEMEVPEARDVGWYSYGAAPGEPGAAVLAAHVAYDGIDGVFVNLTRLAAGDQIVVRFDDGSAKTFTVDSLTAYKKDELPDSLFARAGDSSLVLITCGGDFQQSIRSYEDNIVAVASPSE